MSWLNYLSDDSNVLIVAELFNTLQLLGLDL